MNHPEKNSALKETQSLYTHLCFDQDFSFEEKKLASFLSTETIKHVLGQDSKKRAIYRELVFNNMFSIIEKALPLSFYFLESLDNKLEKKIKISEVFVRDFLSLHKPRTNYYRQIPHDFISYLFDSSGNVRENLSPALKAIFVKIPFLAELIDYEFNQYTLIFRENLKNRPQHNLETPFEKSRANLNPHYFLKTYQYPVHLISKKIRPHKIQAENTFLLTFRDPDTYKIITWKLNKLAFKFICKLIELPSNTIVESLQQVLSAQKDFLEEEHTELLEFLWELIENKMILALY